MSAFNNQAQAFLSQKRIAVVGASDSSGHTGGGIYTALRDKGYQVFPVNPKYEHVAGDVAYARVNDIPGGVDGALIATPPAATEQVVQDCAEAGVKRVWMHYNALFGEASSSVSDKAVAYCKEHNIEVIAGGCPLMFLDFPHSCMRFVLGVMNKLPT